MSINTKIIVSYIIFYYYRPTKSFPLPISNSLNLFESQKQININIKNLLAQFFCENNVFLESEINRLLPILNQSFINDIRQVAIDNFFINGKFNKEEFNRLLFLDKKKSLWLSTFKKLTRCYFFGKKC